MEGLLTSGKNAVFVPSCPRRVLSIGNGTFGILAHGLPQRYFEIGNYLY